MTKLSEAKIMGGIGALLSLLVFIPTIGWLISIVGLVLVFVAVKHIADETKDHNIFQNYLMNFILIIIAIVAVGAIMISAFGLAGGMSMFTTMQQQNYTDFNTFWADFGEQLGTLFIGCILAFLIAWVLLIVGTLYLRKSYNSIAEHTKVDLFKTTGLVYFIGALTFIIIIGVFIIIVAKILEIIAFFSLPENLPTATEPPQTANP
jgi:uncharacterized membrane protein